MNVAIMMKRGRAERRIVAMIERLPMRCCFRTVRMVMVMLLAARRRMGARTIIER